jgi:hypothetical protein
LQCPRCRGAAAVDGVQFQQRGAGARTRSIGLRLTGPIGSCPKAK